MTNYCHKKRKLSGVIMSFMLYSLSNVVMSGTVSAGCARARVRACVLMLWLLFAVLLPLVRHPSFMVVHN